LRPVSLLNSEAAEEESLDALAARARACRICRDAPSAGAPLPDPRPVFAASATARICIASQAPGLRAHESGLPFDDRSGDRLRSWMGLSRAEFYDAARIAILPMGFCFPGYDAGGADLPPRPECAPAWRSAFLTRMPQLRLVLCIGLYAQRYHLGRQWRGSLTATVSDWRSILGASRRPRVLPLPHPSWRNSGWLKKNRWFEEELVPVLQEAVRGDGGVGDQRSAPQENA